MVSMQYIGTGMSRLPEAEPAQARCNISGQGCPAYRKPNPPGLDAAYIGTGMSLLPEGKPAQAQCNISG